MGSDEDYTSFKWYSHQELIEKFKGSERNQRRFHKKIEAKKAKKVTKHKP